MPFQPLVHQETAPVVAQPRPLFGVEFRCIYLHEDGEICGHKTDVHWFCTAHLNTPIDANDNVLMGGMRVVPRAKGSFNRMPTHAQMAGYIQWIVTVKQEQVRQMTVLVNDSLVQLRHQANHVAALQEQVANRKPGRRALNALRKVLS
jgi:hypothetical protein